MSYNTRIKNLNGLYVITDNYLTPNDTIFENVQSSLKGGAKVVQLRDKLNDDETVINIATKLQTLCKEYNAIFVMNDRVDLAIKLKTDGLHIGRSDYINFRKIRKDFDGIIGVSCYASIPIAKKFENLGANYVAFGSFFHSNTKPDSHVISFQVLQKAQNELNIPICAIGGITLENLPQIVSYRPNMVSVISDIFGSRDIEQQSKNYVNLLKETIV